MSGFHNSCCVAIIKIVRGNRKKFHNVWQESWKTIMTKISLRKHYLPDITLCWNTFVCECKCGYSLSFPVTITALNDKVFVGYLMVAKDEGTGADLGSFSIISGGKVMCGTTVRTSSWQFQICIYAEGIITSENACFMITVSIKKMSASILKLPTIIITISHVYIFFMLYLILVGTYV